MTGWPIAPSGTLRGIWAGRPEHRAGSDRSDPVEFPLAVETDMAQAQAQPNIALVKYWGKRHGARNLPAVGSLSVTLESLWTRTEVEFDPDLPEDLFLLNGVPDPKGLVRVSRCLDPIRQRASCLHRARIQSRNNFPTSAGLASSASGFAALVTAAIAALCLEVSPEERSEWARGASGSAPRSLYGGFVELRLQETPAPGRTELVPLADPGHWPLEVAVAITSLSAKPVGSTAGMEITAKTSPFYEDWIRAQPADLEAARQAVLARDFEKLALVSEHSCLKMHGLALAAKPGLMYWNGATVSCLTVIRDLRAQGIPVFFTIDAGPQVKAVCEPGASQQVAGILRQIPGVLEVMTSRLGPGARVISGAGKSQPSGP